MTIDVENFSNRSSEPRPIAQGLGHLILISQFALTTGHAVARLSKHVFTGFLIWLNQESQ